MVVGHYYLIYQGDTSKVNKVENAVFGLALVTKLSERIMGKI